MQETDLLNQIGSPESQPQNPTHLLLMVNGLFGSMENWAVTQRNLKKLGKQSDLLMLASNANLRMQVPFPHATGSHLTQHRHVMSQVQCLMLKLS